MAFFFLLTIPLIVAVLGFVVLKTITWKEFLVQVGVQLVVAAASVGIIYSSNTWDSEIMKQNEIYLGDCLELMPQIADASIDMILCDLPYGTTACSWDTIIPLDKLWEQYKRIIKNNGAIILFGSQPFTTKLINSNIDNFKEELIWLKNKAGSGMQTNQKHQKIHENIIVFSFDNKYTYNPVKWLIAEKEFITQRKTFKDNEFVGNTIYGATTRTRKIDTGERNPLSIVSCAVPFTPQNSKTYSNDIDLRLHPTQKPLPLIEYLIETFSNEGDLILDSCCGSGTTGLGAKNLNRNFIMMDKEQKYVDIAKSRIYGTI